jgi:T5SS/PEP-CTERM-associated repeat protein
MQTAYGVFFGEYTSGNSLIVEDGAVFEGGSSTLGGITGTDNNITVTGTGSSITAELQIGYGFGDATAYDASYSGNNVLTVENGASCTKLAIIGGQNNNGNHVYVIGTGHGDTKTSITNTTDLQIGNSSNNNTLSISGGASGSYTELTLGGGEYAGNHNSVTVKDAGSSLAITGDVYLGFNSTEGIGNSLSVENGAHLTCANLYVSGNVGNNSNVLSVNGAGSLTVVSGTLSIGYSDTDGVSSSNVVKIENGAILACNTISIVSNNYIDFANGFLALTGEYTDSAVHTLLDGKYQVYSGGVYTSSGTLTVTNCTSVAEIRLLLGATYSAAYSDSDLASLVNYTFVTGGEYIVPEPATYAGFAGVAALGIAILFRRRRSK